MACKGSCMTYEVVPFAATEPEIAAYHELMVEMTKFELPG